MLSNYSTVFVFMNSPDTLKSTGPDFSSSVVSPKLYASMERMDSFSGLLESLNLAVRGLEVQSSLYYSIFFLVRRAQKLISTMTFQVI